jgi:5-methyltetrahydropteroyltriglutamate--homocysteine methyltransferase
MLLPTTLVGSYAQPEWLIDRAKLAGRFPPRVRAKELWRIPEPYLAEAQDDATVLAIKAQEDAGLDIITDGEIRRESNSNRFATALEGIDIDEPGMALDRSGHPNPVPRIVGPIRRKRPVEVDDLKFLRAHTARTVKMTVPGPFTMSQQAQNDFYPSLAEAAMDYAEAVNTEIKDLFAAGAGIVQIDEPYMQARPGPAADYGLAALNRALEGVNGMTAVHICFGYAAIIHQRPSAYSFLPQLKGCRCRQISIETAQSNLDCAVLEELPDQTIILGVLDLSTPEIETPETVAARIRRALRPNWPRHEPGRRLRGDAARAAASAIIRSHLRTHQPHGFFRAKHMIVKVRDPLPAGCGQGQIFHPVLDIHRHAVPEKPRILLQEVGRGFVAELPVAADFLEFVKERVGLLRIERVAKLSDEIGGLNQPRLETRFVVAVGARGKAGKFDRVGHARGVNERRIAEPLVDEELRPVDMIGCQRGVGGAARQLHRLAAAIDDEFGTGVAAQNSANEADVVQKTGDDEVTVIVGLEPLRQRAPEQDVAADRRHQDGMLEVVVEGVAPAEALDRDPRQPAHALG